MDVLLMIKKGCDYRVGACGQRGVMNRVIDDGQ